MARQARIGAPEPVFKDPSEILRQVQVFSTYICVLEKLYSYIIRITENQSCFGFFLRIGKPESEIIEGDVLNALTILLPAFFM
jgi:hypothetical protein